MTPPSAIPDAAVNTSLEAAVSIARRDLLEFVRDRRTLFVTLLLPMVTYPLVALSSALGLRTAVSDLEARAAPTPLTVAMSGPEAGALARRIDGVVQRGKPVNTGEISWPSAMSFLHGDPETAIAAVEDGAADVWIDAPEGIVSALDAEGTVDLDVRFPSRRPSGRSREQFEGVIRGVAEAIRTSRVNRAGLPDSVLQPIRLRVLGETAGVPAVATEQILPALTASILVLLSVLTMTGAFYPAIDAIAGEKERGTIETLLMAPCSTGSIVFGKFLAVYAVTLATLAANCLSIALTGAVGLRFLPAVQLPALGAGAAVTVIAFVGLAALAAATCLAVTTASKSGKEAQNTLTPVILLVAALSGMALVPGFRGDGALALVPFMGQVMVARDTLTLTPDPNGGGIISALLPLLLTLLSSALLTALLLRGTATLLTDEEILFRGPDAAGGLLARPAPRVVPTISQGIIPVVAGMAALWYVQAFTPENLLMGIPIHQGIAVLLPLLAMLSWQRVDLGQTLGLGLPRSAGRTVAAVLGAASLGAGLFIVSAAFMLALQGTEVSPAIRSLSERLIGLIQQHPWWVSWTLMALLPPVAEELLFRGWLLSALAGERPTRGRLAAAVVVQAALFAVAHVLPERMPATFSLGIVAGVLRVATGSLLPAVVLHSVHNTMPLLLLALAGGGVDGSVQELATGASTTLPAGALPVALLLMAIGAGLVALAARGGGRTATVVALVLASGGAWGSAAADGAETLRVGVAPVGLTLQIVDGQATGPSVDMWNDMSLRLGITTEYVVTDSIVEGLAGVRTGEVDLFLGPVAMTREREEIFDFTHSVFHSGLRIAVPKTDDDSYLGPLSILLTRGALQLLAGLVLLTVLVGHVLWWLERGVNEKSFPRDWRHGVWEGTWWGISTLIASGCDDKHVDTVPGRILATAWMLVGTVLIALFTGSLAATLTAERIGGTIHGPRDMAGRLIAAQANGVSGQAIRARGGIPVELRTLDDVFAAADAGEVDAVIAENQTLRHAISRPDRSNYRLVGPVFESFDFGLVLPAGSPLRERLNAVILSMREDGAIDTIIDRWLGTAE
ncbi:MAG: transporter substrate-binding domain-containing protein [Planctomycetaceae bacterium]|nr:transporter substrate-binding domain-containing protein [Planctomycetaceae bacterium]